MQEQLYLINLLRQKLDKEGWEIFLRLEELFVQELSNYTKENP